MQSSHSFGKLSFEPEPVMLSNHDSNDKAVEQNLKYHMPLPWTYKYSLFIIAVMSQTAYTTNSISTTWCNNEDTHLKAELLRTNYLNGTRKKD